MELLSYLLSNANYVVSSILMVLGFFTVIASDNFVKKLMGLSIFQVSVLLFYISVSKVSGAAVPIFVEGKDFYVNPLPHVLMLTAIVVGVAVMAVGLAIIVRIKEAYGTIEEQEIIQKDIEINTQERKL